MMELIENIEYDHTGLGKYLRSENLQGLDAFIYMVVGYQTLWKQLNDEKLTSGAIYFVKNSHDTNVQALSLP